MVQKNFYDPIRVNFIRAWLEWDLRLSIRLLQCANKQVKENKAIELNFDQKINVNYYQFSRNIICIFCSKSSIWFSSFSFIKLHIKSL